MQDLRGKRKYEVNDIVKRKIVISPENVRVENFPIKKPAAIFNPSLFLENGEMKMYARIIVGYYKYISAVAEVKESEFFSKGRIVIFPDTEFDAMGAEDPRVYEFQRKILMTYTGRTHRYFECDALGKAIPVTAQKAEEEWKKICAMKFKKEIRENLRITSNKNAFFAEIGKEARFFHRAHDENGNFYLLISEFEEDFPSGDRIKEVCIINPRQILLQEKFEDKVGWCSPPLKIGKEYLFFLHAMESKLKSYRIFALVMDENLRVTAITPYYIMAPKEVYEIYGDRSLTIFPCGALRVDEKILISYGAADSFACIGEINLDELLAILEKNRIEA